MSLVVSNTLSKPVQETCPDLGRFYNPGMNNYLCVERDIELAPQQTSASLYLRVQTIGTFDALDNYGVTGIRWPYNEDLAT